MVDDLRFPNQDLRNKDFKDLAAGDETHRYGDYIPRVAAEELTVGDLVAINEYGEAVPYDGESDLLGVVYSNVNDDVGPETPEEDAVVESGEAFTAKVQGTVIAATPEDADATYNPDEGSVEAGRGPSGELVLDVSEEDDFVHLLLP